MQFKTETLRAAVESAIEQHKINHERDNNVRRRKHEDAAAEFVRSYGPAWSDAATKIRAAVKAGRPITEDVLPRKTGIGYHSIPVFDNKQPRDTPYAIDGDLIVMRNALRLITDEFVTTTSLKTLGVRSGMLRTVCELATEETAKRQAKADAASAKPTTTRKRVDRNRTALRTPETS